MQNHLIPANNMVEYFKSPDLPGYYRFDLALPEDFDVRTDKLPLRDWFQSVPHFQWDGQIFESQPMRTYFDVPAESVKQVLSILEQQLGTSLSHLNRSPFDRPTAQSDGYYTVHGESDDADGVNGDGGDGWTRLTVYSMQMTPIAPLLEVEGLEVRVDGVYAKSIPPQLTVMVNRNQRLPNGGNALDRVRELLMMNGFAEEEKSS